MTKKKKKKRTHKKRSGPAGMAIYVRCRFCGEEFTGNPKALKEWSEHLVLCEKKRKKKTKKK